MVLTIEFFLGLVVAFYIGYLISIGMEKVFHLNLDNSDDHE